MSSAVVLAAALAGFGAGGLGALLGLGGAIILIPVLNLGLGLSYDQAAGVSLMTVVATSSFVSRDKNSRPFVNARLAVVLLTMSVLGASAARSIVGLPDHVSKRLFGATAIVVAAIMLARLRKRNVIHDTNVDPGSLGGRFVDADTKVEVVYQAKRVPLALAIAFTAGMVSTVVGVGGGILLVPMLNSWCGVPLRAAAATSAMMIGVTAVPGLVERRADLTLPMIEIATIVGVLAGSRAGFWLGARSPVQALKLLMAGILTVVGGTYLIRASGAPSSSIAVIPVDGSPDWLRTVVNIGLVVLVCVPLLGIVDVARREWRRRAWPFVGAAVVVLAIIAVNVFRR